MTESSQFSTNIVRALRTCSAGLQTRGRSLKPNPKQGSHASFSGVPFGRRMRIVRRAQYHTCKIEPQSEVERTYYV